MLKVIFLPWNTYRNNKITGEEMEFWTTNYSIIAIGLLLFRGRGRFYPFLVI